MKPLRLTMILWMGLATTLTMSSCASPRLIILADGTKVPPAPTYLSTKEMESKGKNNFGVPETSFAFYPEKWTPEKKNVMGNTPEEFEAFKKAAIAEGRQVVCFGFTPSGTPRWDSSFCDPPTVRHDCFSAERLFVVPWGDGTPEMPVKMGKEKQLIALFYSQNDEIVIWTEASGRAYFLNIAGGVTKVLQTSKMALYDLPELKVQESEWRIPKLFGAKAPAGISLDWGPTVTSSREPSRPWKFTILDSERMALCSLYLPANVPDEGDGLEAWAEFRESAYVRFGVKADGRIFYPVVSGKGLEMYVYTPR